LTHKDIVLILAIIVVVVILLSGCDTYHVTREHADYVCREEGGVSSIIENRMSLQYIIACKSGYIKKGFL
jgi:hypothetical protein